MRSVSGAVAGGAVRTEGAISPGDRRRSAGARRATTLLLALSAALAPVVPLAAQSIPTPADHLGFQPGSDRRLADYTQILGYFQALDAVSERLRLERIGETAEGRPMVLAAVSSAENLRRLDRYREISRRLALGADADSAAARRLAREGRAIVWIDGGLHSTEVAGAQFMPILAHRLVMDESEEIRRMREQTILLLMPVMNPDGLEVVVDWYREQLGTEFETASLPRLYHRYVGHDNNRDWFMLLMPESRAVARQLWEVWYPQIVVNHHQTGALSPGRIFIPPFADPVNPHIPPLVVAGNNLLGTAIARRFVEEGKPGVISRHRFSQWWNGGMRTAPYFHNQVGILTEVAVDDYATPKFHHPDSLPAVHSSGIPGDRPSTWYPLPWEGGWWRLSDQTDYMLTASLAVADMAARLKEDWLIGAWGMARQAIRAGEAGDPFAYLVDLAGQHDAGAAAEMLEALLRGGVKVRRATGAFRAEDRDWPAGTYVVPAGQAFRPLVLDLLEPQVHPDRRLYPGGPPDPPYDLAGWTLPIQMGVDVARVEAPFRARTERVEGTEIPRNGGVEGRGDAFLLGPGQNAAFRAVNRLLGEDVRVDRATEAFEAAGRTWSAGTFVASGSRAAVEEAGRQAGVMWVGAASPDVRRVSLTAPRVGLYRSWVANMDEGWTRWLLERYGFEYENLTDEDVRSGDLSRFHAIILPDQEPDELLNGHAPGTMPSRYVGGLGAEGAARLKRFVQEGGLLLALDDAADFAIRQFGLPVRNATAELSQDELFIPGSLIRLAPEPGHTIVWGMQDEAAAFYVRGRAFQPVEPASAGGRSALSDVEVVARYGDGDLLLSGWELGADERLSGRPAVVRVPLGAGSVVLVGFRPQFRAQPAGTFKLVFNPLLEAAATGDGRSATADGR